MNGYYHASSRNGREHARPRASIQRWPEFVWANWQIMSQSITQTIISGGAVILSEQCKIGSEALNQIGST